MILQCQSGVYLAIKAHLIQPSFGQTSSPVHSQFAYVFYASDSTYLCYVLVNVHRLLHVYNTSRDIDVVIIVKGNVYDLKVRTEQTKYCSRCACISTFLQSINRRFCFADCFGDRVRILAHDAPKVQSDANQF